MISEDTIDICLRSRQFASQMAENAYAAGDQGAYRRWSDLARWWKEREAFVRGQKAFADAREAKPTLVTAPDAELGPGNTQSKAEGRS